MPDAHQPNLPLDERFRQAEQRGYKNSRTNKNGVNIEKGKYKVTVGGVKNRVYGGYHTTLEKAVEVRSQLEKQLNYKNV